MEYFAHPHTGEILGDHTHRRLDLLILTRDEVEILKRIVSIGTWDVRNLSSAEKELIQKVMDNNG